MKKTILVALSIVLMLFAFASCSNDSGKPGFTGDASEVAEALDPAKLVGDVLKPGAENVDVEYKLIQQGGASSSAAKATAESATLQATVTFDGYKVPNTSYVITDGTLVYTFEGTVSAEGKFTANSTATVKTGSKLIVDTDKGNAEVSISEVKASVNAFTADVSKAGSDGVLPADTAITVNVTVDEDIKVSVGDKDVTVKPEEPAPEPDPKQTISNEEELRTASSSGKGVYYLTKDIALDSQLNITAPITIDGEGKWTISRDTAGKASGDMKTNAIILITADGVTLQNLKVEGSSAATDDWDNGEYGIKIYDAENVTLRNVSVTKVNAGVLVNGSKATLEGTVDVTGNIFGGIEVSKGEAAALTPSTLTINGTVVCTDTEVPAVWIDGIDAENTVNGTGAAAMISFDSVTKPEQKWFITKAQEDYPVNQSGKTVLDEASDFSNLTAGSYIITKDVILDNPVKISASDITIYGAGHKITAPVDSVSQNSAPIVISGSNVEISDVVFEMSGTSSNSVFAIQLGSGEGVIENAPNEIVLSDVEIVNNEKTGGINIHTAKDVVLENITSDASNKAPINISSSSVTLTGDFSLAESAWKYDVQVNGNGGSPEHKASTVDFSNTTGINGVWQEYVGSDATMPDGTNVSDGGQSKITAPVDFTAEVVESKGWYWSKTQNN